MVPHVETIGSAAVLKGRDDCLETIVVACRWVPPHSVTGQALNAERERSRCSKDPQAHLGGGSRFR